MNEYGGFIEFEYYGGEEYHKNAIALNSGRHCVEYLIKAKGIKRYIISAYTNTTNSLGTILFKAKSLEEIQNLADNIEKYMKVIVS